MAARYLKAAGGNFNGANWSATSAAGVDSLTPTAVDDCILELASGNLTINSGSVCRSLDCTSGVGTYAGTITHTASVTLSIGDGTAGAGSVALKLRCGTYTLGDPVSSAISFISTSATQQTIDYGSKTSGSVTINGAGSNYQLTAAITTTGAWTYTAGTTFSANGQTITTTQSSSTFGGGGKTYATVQLNGGGIATVTGTNTFSALSRVGTAATNNSLSFSADQTVTASMTCQGANATTQRLLVTSNTRGTARTITRTGAAMDAWQNVDVEDIVFDTVFDASAITGGSGNCGGNTNITFSTPLTVYYQTGTSDNVSTTAKWFLATNGGGGAGRAPLAQDIGRFDANSVTAGSVTITQDMQRTGSLDFTGVTNSPTFSNSLSTVYGSLTLATGIGTYSGTSTLRFVTRGTVSITSAGQTITNAINVDSPGGTVMIADAFVTSGSAFTLTQGTHAVANVTFQAVQYISNSSNVRTITQGTGVWTITGNGATIWSLATVTNCTFTTRPAITCNYSGATGSRTITHGSTAGGTEANALDVNVTAGTDSVVFTTSDVLHNVNFTGFAGTRTNTVVTYYGSLTISTGMTVTAGTAISTFAATSGAQIVTSTKNLDFPITINCPGATFQLGGNLAQGTATSRAVVFTAGIVDLGNKTWTHFGTWALASTGTRTLTNGTLSLTLDTASTPWSYTGSNFSATTATIKYSSTTNNAQTFDGGGGTYSTVTFDRGASTAAITITGSNTFLSLNDLGTAAHSLLTTVATTQTISICNLGLAGRGTNVLTINSTTTGTFAWVKTGGGTISSDYLNIQHCIATPTLTWYAGANSTDNQANATAGSGWVFTVAPPPTTSGSLPTRPGRFLRNVVGYWRRIR